LYQRDDDKPDTVRARLQVYQKQTAPLIEYYSSAGLLIDVDGSGDIGTVSSALLAATCEIIHASGADCIHPWCRCADEC
jgi:adenylate kinase